MVRRGSRGVNAPPVPERTPPPLRTCHNSLRALLACPSAPIHSPHLVLSLDETSRRHYLASRLPVGRGIAECYTRSWSFHEKTPPYDTHFASSPPDSCFAGRRVRAEPD